MMTQDSSRIAKADLLSILLQIVKCDDLGCSFARIVK